VAALRASLTAILSRLHRFATTAFGGGLSGANLQQPENHAQKIAKARRYRRAASASGFTSLTSLIALPRALR
jgi:hypothetical protein